MVRDSCTLSVFANTRVPSGLRITGGRVARPGGGRFGLKPSNRPGDTRSKYLKTNEGTGGGDGGRRPSWGILPAPRGVRGLPRQQRPCCPRCSDEITTVTAATQSPGTRCGSVLGFVLRNSAKRFSPLTAPRENKDTFPASGTLGTPTDDSQTAQGKVLRVYAAVRRRGRTGLFWNGVRRVPDMGTGPEGAS